MDEHVDVHTSHICHNWSNRLSVHWRAFGYSTFCWIGVVADNCLFHTSLVVVLVVSANIRALVVVLVVSPEIRALVPAIHALFVSAIRALVVVVSPEIRALFVSAIHALFVSAIRALVVVVSAIRALVFVVSAEI